MNFFSFLWSQYKTASVKLGTQMQGIDTNGVNNVPEQISTVFTCFDRLSAAVSRMPISIFADNQMGRMELKQHRLYWLLRYQPNPSQNAQQFWSTVELHVNKFGNGLVRAHKNAQSAYVQRFEIIHPERIENITITDGIVISYKIRNTTGSGSQEIPASDMLHFHDLSEDGIIGLPKLEALTKQTNINQRATAHIDNFHKNNGVQTTALETNMPGELSGPMQGVLIQSRKDYLESNGGPTNSGKPIMLPAFTKIVKLTQSFADSQLIETLKYTREEIAAAFGIPLFMIDGSAEKLDIEQLTLLFRTNTIGPKVAMYVAELTAKLLTTDEILNKGFKIEFDTSVIIEMDYSKKVTTIKEQVVNGLMTPNEAATKLGNKTIPGEFGNYHYMQAQYNPLEKFNDYNSLLKVDPTLKTNKKKTPPTP